MAKNTNLFQKKGTVLIQSGAAKRVPTALPAMDPLGALIDLKRAIYERFGISSTPGYIRSEYLLTGALNQIPWIVNANQQGSTSPTPTERRLAQSDTFTIVSVGMYLSKIPSATLNAPLPAEYPLAKLLTFPNTTVFAGTTAPAENTRLNAIYNGALSVRLDNTVVIDSVPLYSFYRVPESQQGVGAATGVTGVIRDEWDISMYGRCDLRPTIEINGSKQNTFTANLGTQSIDLSPSGTGGTGTNSAVLMLFGLLHQGAADRQNQVQLAVEKAMAGGSIGDILDDLED